MKPLYPGSAPLGEQDEEMLWLSLSYFHLLLTDSSIILSSYLILDYVYGSE